MPDEWVFSVLEMVDKTKEFFIARSVAYGVDYGMKSIGRQLNQGSKGRVSFDLVGGQYKGPVKMGQQRGNDRAARPTYVLNAEIEAHIWAWDEGNLGNDTAQEQAWLIAHEHTLASLWHYDGGDVVPVKLAKYTGPVQINKGIARVVTFTIELPVHAKLDKTRIQVSADVSIGIAKPVANGDSIVDVVRQFEVNP